MVIGYESIVWGLEGATAVARAQGSCFAENCARSALDAIQWKAPEVRRRMVRGFVYAARAVGQVPGPVPPSFYRFLAACVLASLREAW